MSRKLALVIGNSEYEDATIARLRKPDADVRALAEALQDSEIGGFDEVTSLLNEPSHIVRREIARFFAQKIIDDLLLLYFSGHGVRDDFGRLYLAMKDTEHDLLSATAVPAASITEEMDNSRSRWQVLILDCCYAGAFAGGARKSTGDGVGTAVAFQGNGYGRWVLAATDSTQYAWEGDEVIGDAENSVFTHYLIQGLRTGEADADSNGEITINELHDYTYGQVVASTSKQKPGKWSFREQGDLVIARNLRPPKPAELSLELRNAIDSEFARVREGAIKELTGLQQGSHRGLSLTAKEMLEYMAEHDDSRRVSALAVEALDATAVERSRSPIKEEEPVIEEVGTERAETEAAQERAEEEERERGPQEQLSSLYQEGVRAVEAEHWDGAIGAFQNVLAVDSRYGDAAARLELAEAKKKAEEKRQGQLAVTERRREEEISEREVAVRIPSYWLAVGLHVLFGFGLFYVDRSLRRRWVYPVFPLYMAFVYLTFAWIVAEFGYLHDFYDSTSEFAGWTLLSAGILWGFSLVDVIWSCHSRRRARS